MRTTLDLDEDLLREALRETGAPTKKAVVEMGLRALLEKAARERLAALHGKIPEATTPSRRRARTSEG